MKMRYQAVAVIALAFVMLAPLSAWAMDEEPAVADTVAIVEDRSQVPLERQKRLTNLQKQILQQK